MSRKLPPLNPLRTFESAARNGSFTRAAEELLVSQSAVSRQISLLETYLEIELFQRRGRTTSLTPAGARYYAEIGPAFESLGMATQRLRQSTAKTPLVIKVYTTFAAKWLMRRLPHFQLLHPDINIRINTVVKPVDFNRDTVDAAIQLGTENWEGCESVLLFADEIAPVCSPTLLDKLHQPPPLPLSSLKNFQLLHAHYRRSDWSDWLQAVNAPVIEQNEPMVFPSSLLTYQAATDGLGMAMGQLPLLREELEAGTLVRPFQGSLKRDLAYYFVTPAASIKRIDSRIEKFREWILTEL